MVLTLDCEHHPVEMPFISTSRLTPAKLIEMAFAELQRPLANRLIRDDDVTAGHLIFYVAKTQWVCHVPACTMDHDFQWIV